MIDLISQYSLNDLLIFTITLVVAIKGTWDIVEYFISKYKAKFNKDYSVLEKERIAEERQKTLEQHYANCQLQHNETIERYTALGEKIDALVDTINDKFEAMDQRMDLLTESDTLDIKQSIVMAFHLYVEEQGWIDDFALDILEKRFKVYEAEGGNSYAAGLMSEIRQLPKHPPK